MDADVIKITKYKTKYSKVTSDASDIPCWKK
jgi:hypothetical protein